ncbi:hypothetical protein THOM_1706 [Trachipleistophora hominis]|uniref:Uncharacterized protein n=1 Tax=Trachipleistophora hominis TaxID=72359 RepID=L7JVJ5_TRAHO|nr:hypothetical protein THOM_1706 [Trachipleistophora hominis]
MKYSVIFVLVILSNEVHMDHSFHTNIIRTTSESFVERMRSNEQVNADKVRKDIQKSPCYSSENICAGKTLDCDALASKIENNMTRENELSRTDGVNLIVNERLSTSKRLQDHPRTSADKAVRTILENNLLEVEKRSRDENSGIGCNEIKNDESLRERTPNIQNCLFQHSTDNTMHNKFFKDFNEKQQLERANKTKGQARIKMFYFYSSSSDSDDQGLTHVTCSHKERPSRDEDARDRSRCLKYDIYMLKIFVNITTYNLKAYVSRTTEGLYAVRSLVVILEQFRYFLHDVSKRNDKTEIIPVKHSLVHKLRSSFPSSFRKIMEMLYGISDSRRICSSIARLIEQISSVRNN